jgi:transmembrane sensor
LSSNEDIEQLLSDHDFRLWVTQPTDDLDSYWQAWLLAYPEKRDAFYLAKEIAQSLLTDGMTISHERVEHNIENILDETVRKIPKGNVPSFWYSMAASLLLTAGFIFYKVKLDNNGRPVDANLHSTAVQWLKFVNTGEAPEHIVLPDGSTVIVLPNSSIRYPQTFNDTLRSVKLSGEAFFEVTKEMNRPFVVSSTHLQTRVLGTSFRVRDVAEEAPLVRVKTGTVAVNFAAIKASGNVSDAIQDHIILKSEQEMFFADAGSQSLPVSLGTSDASIPVLAIESNTFVYRRTPVSDVFAALEDTYGIDIQYDAQILSHCTLTAKLSDQPLLEKLRMVCLGLNLQYSINKAGIVTIYGQGCK